MAMKSWVESANVAGTDFPLENLPYGVFRHDHTTRIGIAIGEQVLDLRACAERGLLSELEPEVVAACSEESLNVLMSLGPSAWSALRRQITTLLASDRADAQMQARVKPLLISMSDVACSCPRGSATIPISTLRFITQPAWESSSVLTIRCCPTTNMFRLATMAGRRRSW